MRILYCLLVVIIFFTGCDDDKAVQVGENTFVYNGNVYKLIDNELTRLSEIESSDSIKPKLREFGNASISFVKEGASAQINGLYRGNYFYFKLRILGLNDLREKYAMGQFIIEFTDEYGYVLHSTPILVSDLIGIIGDNSKIQYYEYNGKTEMNPNIFNVIKTFSVSSTVKAKGKNSYGY